MRPSRVTALVLAYLSTVAAAAGLATSLGGFGAPVRGVLRVHFTTIAHHVGEAVGIWVHNATIVAGFAIFLGGARLAQRDPTASRAERAILRACDLALLAWANGSAILAGLLTGAYGPRQLHAFLPQAPVEITAWALLIALYIDVRRQRATVLEIVWGFGVVLALLAAGAVLELWAGA